MTNLSQSFRRRVTALVVGLILIVLASVLLAVAVHRDARDKLGQLAHVELEASSLARQFRDAVGSLHGALIRIGHETPDQCASVVKREQQKMTEWLNARRAAINSDDEKRIVENLAAETQSFVKQLDELAERTNGWSSPPDRDTIIMLDDRANLLERHADDFAAAHVEKLRGLLKASLSSLLWMRDLIFGCLGMLLAIVTIVVILLYRDVVRPMSEQLVDRDRLLAKREKLAALGTLAAGVAHEIRNPLTAIKAQVYTLGRSELSAANLGHLKAISGEVNRMESIVRDVLGYARPSDAALGPVELSSWLREFGTSIGQTFNATSVTLNVATDVTANVLIDDHKLRQILQNLVRNAQEALEGRPGRIELALQRERIVLQGKMSDVAVISVTDDGPGIPVKIQPRLFDPFFTTKPSGTGLGLSIVARLVELQGGDIKFQSSPGAGTRFTVRLPIHTGTEQSGES